MLTDEGTYAAMIERHSLYHHAVLEAKRYKSQKSQEAGYDVGQSAIQEWNKKYWWAWSRARWLEHLRGEKYWVELDKGDFGILHGELDGDTILIDRILDRLKEGWENLDIIVWAMRWNLDVQEVIRILEKLDVNSRRLKLE